MGPRRRPAVNFLGREGDGPQRKDPVLRLSLIFILVGLPPSRLFTLTSLLSHHPSALCLLSSPSLASQYNSSIKAYVAVTTALTEKHPDLSPHRPPFRPASLIGWFDQWTLRTRWLPPPASCTERLPGRWIWIRCSYLPLFHRRLASANGSSKDDARLDNWQPRGGRVWHGFIPGAGNWWWTAVRGGRRGSGQAMWSNATSDRWRPHDITGMTRTERVSQSESRTDCTEQTEVTHCYETDHLHVNRCYTEPGALWALTDFCLLPSGLWFYLVTVAKLWLDNCSSAKLLKLNLSTVWNLCIILEQQRMLHRYHHMKAESY